MLLVLYLTATLDEQILQVSGCSPILVVHCGLGWVGLGFSPVCPLEVPWANVELIRSTPRCCGVLFLHLFGHKPGRPLQDPPQLPIVLDSGDWPLNLGSCHLVLEPPDDRLQDAP